MCSLWPETNLRLLMILRNAFYYREQMDQMVPLDLMELLANR